MTPDRKHHCLAATFLAVLASLVLAGCATPRVPVDPALFPRASGAAASPANVRLALIADAALTGYERVGDPWRDSGTTIPTGRIIEAAAATALADVLGRPVTRFPDAASAIASARSGPPITLVTLRPIGQEIPVRGRGLAVRLTLDCQVMDASGALIWSKRYDSGAVGLSVEQVNDRSADAHLQELRAVHRAAYEVMVQVAEDYRRWLEAERLRERVL